MPNLTGRSVVMKGAKRKSVSKKPVFEGKLEWIQKKPCCNCSSMGEWVEAIGEYRCQAAHVTRANNRGIATKPSDRYLVPLCATCHAWQHHYGESVMSVDFDEVAELNHIEWLEEKLIGKIQNL